MPDRDSQGEGRRRAACAVVQWLMAACAAFAPCLASAGMPGLTQDEQAWLRAHPVLHIGVNRSAPPFTYEEGGRHRGIDADILRRLAQMLEVRFDPVLDRPWDEVQAMARDGRIDMIGLIPETPERREHLRFTVPVTDVEYALFVRSDSPQSAGISDLTGHRIAVVGTFAVRRWLERDYPGVQVVAAESAIDALQRLSTGQVDGAVSTVGAGSWLIRQKGIVNLQVGQSLYRPLLAIGVRKDWPQLETILNKAIAQLPPSEIDHIKADYIQLSTGGYSRGQIAAAVGVTALVAAIVVLMLISISLRRQRDLARLGQASEQRFRLLYEHSLDAVLLTQPGGDILAANPAACAMFGRTEDEVCAAGRTGLVDLSDPRLPGLLQERSDTGRARGALRMRRRDGTPFEAEISSAVYTGPDGESLSSIIVRDVSERLRAETSLRLLEAAVAHLNDIVIITEAQPLEEPGPRIVYANTALTRASGWDVGEAMGRSPRMLQGPLTSPAELVRIGSALREGKPVRAELVNYRRDGHPYWVELQVVPLIDPSGNITHFAAVERLIDERKQAELTREALESQLRASQKMEAIGTLAGGIAHDFNNILGALMGDVTLARDELPAEHPLQPTLQRIQRAASRARRLVEQILTFSRRRPTLLEPMLLAPLVEETVSMLRSTLPATVRLKVDLADPGVQVAADATQMQQVLMNLCTNAWQAIHDGNGCIAIRLRRSPPGDPRQTARGLPPARYAVLSVEDSGSGMDVDTQARIFEPFFTTKQPGQGTGLGLSVVHGIVRGHHGLIEVHSTLGAGTRFDIWLPEIDAAGRPAAVEPTPADALVPRGRGERVLVVDDDEVMRLMVERLLERLGYKPECVADPLEGLRRVRAQPDRYDIVVTDYNMPGMDGVMLAQALHAAAPRLPVILGSGFVSEALEAQAHGAGVQTLLRKERTLEDLPLLLDRMVHAVP